tara:strand:+ start:498 stop:926 length:429 start_codon:yes stop_codon:yes gene_type:complete
MSEKKVETEKKVELNEIKIVVEEIQDKLEEKVMNQVKEQLKNTEINMPNVMKIVKITMEVIELTEVKGEKQKDLAVKVVKKIVSGAPIVDDQKKSIIQMIDGEVLSSTIDLIVAASKGQLNINVVKKAATGCVDFVRRLLKR